MLVTFCVKISNLLLFSSLSVFLFRLIFYNCSEMNYVCTISHIITLWFCIFINRGLTTSQTPTFF